MTPPRRIASLLPSATEILWALGLADRVVAVSHECDFPPEARQRPKASRSLIDASRPSGPIDDEVRHRLSAGLALYELDAALLKRLAPDLIITQAQCDVCAIRFEDVMQLVRGAPELEQAVVLPLQPAGLSDILRDIEEIGRVTSADDSARQLVGSLVSRIDSVRGVTGQLDASHRPCIVCIEWIQPLMTAGNCVPQLVELAGGQCLLATEGQHSPYVSWESIREANPDVIVIAPCGFDLPRTMTEAKTLHQLPGWSELSAVERGCVWAVDGNSYFNRSGPRIVDTLEILAHILHPEQFAAPESAAIRKAP